VRASGWPEEPYHKIHRRIYQRATWECGDAFGPGLFVSHLQNRARLGDHEPVRAEAKYVTAAVILAAGAGSRMRSHRAKVLHEVGGLPLLEHVLRRVAELGLSEIIVVTGYDHDHVDALVGQRARIIHQPAVLGTGDAVGRALAALSPGVDRVLVLYGDAPLVPADLLANLCRAGDERPGAVLVTAQVDDPTGYGRIVRDAEGQVTGIVEERDLTPDQRRIREINSGIGIWPRTALAAVLPALPRHGEEQYLTDAVAALLQRGVPVDTLQAPDPDGVMGINTRAELARAEALVRRQTLERLMAGGVTILDPATTFIDAAVQIGMDTVIFPMTTIRGRTVIGEGVRIGPMATIVDSEVADGVVVEQAVVMQSHVGPHSEVGPFSHLRPGTYLDRDVHIGNFVELKNARVGMGTKAGHHCYLGDVTIGTHVNIGAGTVVVNFDGTAKHPTFIGDGAFVGCNSNLVAPVEIGAGAYIAAGSTITHNVPADALAIARNRQENKPDWARNRRAPHDLRR